MRTRRYFLTILALYAVLVLGTLANASQPNVILLVTDDQGYGDIAATWQSGHQNAEYRPIAQRKHGGYCDSGGNLMRATATGYWNVVVDRAGVYELELRRWPIEANLPLSAGVGRDGMVGARPIAAANVQIAGTNCTLDSAPRDTHVTFRLKLERGKAQLATAVLNRQDRTLCSAIYVKLTRLPSDTQATLTPTVRCHWGFG